EDQQETDAEDFVHSLKVDMFDDEVFVFTPRGKVISLPRGSTPIDFAYAIHSGVGNAMIGAKINNRIAGYDVALHNGDIVEILTSKSAKGPSRDWLNICKSNQARSKIKQWFKKEKREENIVRGKASFESELHRLSVSPSVLQDEELLQTLLRKLSFDNIDDLYASIGYGGLTAAKAVGKIKEDLLKAGRANAPKEPVKPTVVQNVKTDRHAASGVIVEDIGSCMIKFSRCCTPVPGDDIVGFITKGYGVSIHRRDCPNAQGAEDPAQKDRWVRVSWAESEDKPFATTLEVVANDRDGMLVDVAAALTSQQLRMKEISGKELPNGLCQFTVTFEVKSTEELSTAMGRIRSVNGVRSVRRGKS
ncbi:MAG: bifunctional (p)ppGpp synthetase/guanosine-3',5'-bis(diphosphate) 3'-pyrophosphohydrolase, partial [Oscillospiraceae bacterium]|nr:bifunctional (p)ppGpp synthetase/guanosine-3',5'-bis(diphosphate) 3'-pyrophosphohydrolase [Oscillospiraceae bacterium]